MFLWAGLLHFHVSFADQTRVLRRSLYRCHPIPNMCWRHRWPISSYHWSNILVPGNPTPWHRLEAAIVNRPVVKFICWARGTEFNNFCQGVEVIWQVTVHNDHGVDYLLDKNFTFRFIGIDQASGDILHNVTMGEEGPWGVRLRSNVRVIWMSSLWQQVGKCARPLHTRWCKYR